jgi:hypothetical protein
MKNTPATALTAMATRVQKGSSAFSTVPRNGTSAISGIAAMSWNSSTANAERPVGVGSSLRSVIAWIAIAVDESASARPATSAACHGRPSARKAAPRTTPHSAICIEPPPKTSLRMASSRRGSSSRPITNSIRTTPSSAMRSMAWTSMMSRSPQGPMSAPAMR